jgi:hypothetical protein
MAESTNPLPLSSPMRPEAISTSASVLARSRAMSWSSSFPASAEKITAALVACSCAVIFGFLSWLCGAHSRFDSALKICQGNNPKLAVGSDQNRVGFFAPASKAGGVFEFVEFVGFVFHNGARIARFLKNVNNFFQKK